MDKYDLVLDIIEHPENYTSGQLKEILSDPETRAIYNLLCKTSSAINARQEPDIDAEWEKFTTHPTRPRRTFLWFGNRAASIATLVGTSIVAIAAGISITVSIIDHTSNEDAVETTIAPATATTTTDSIINDSIGSTPKPILFENETLAAIMTEISKVYGVEVEYANKDAASLHLYYKFDPSLSLNEVLKQLNTFEQINIKQDGNLLTIL